MVHYIKNSFFHWFSMLKMKGEGHCQGWDFFFFRITRGKNFNPGTCTISLIKMHYQVSRTVLGNLVLTGFNVRYCVKVTEVNKDFIYHFCYCSCEILIQQLGRKPRKWAVLSI